MRCWLGLCLFIVLGMSVAACGKRGKLQRPDPLWNGAEEDANAPGSSDENSEDQDEASAAGTGPIHAARTPQIHGEAIA